MNNPWFRNKQYGWGWYPANAKGWAVIIAYIIAVFVLGLRIDAAAHSGSDTVIGMVLPILALTALLIAVSWCTGEKPEWMWGGVPLRTLPEEARVRASAIAVALPLFIGMLVAWTAVRGAFARFYATYETTSFFGTCATFNPIFTPCFFGASAFMVAFVTALWLIYQPSVVWLRHLEGFLWFGTVFAGMVIAYELLQYYGIMGQYGTSCASGVYPLFGTCAVGGVLFLSGALLLKHFRSYAPKG